MSLDAYELCPCGSGKKVKFCCSKDITNELEKLMRLMQGQQRAAALEQADRLISAKGSRAALLIMRWRLQIERDDLEGARETNRQLLAEWPDHPGGLAQQAMLAAEDHELKAAVEGLQSALEQLEGQLVTEPVLEAFGTIGVGLISNGDLVPGLTHLSVYHSLTHAEADSNLHQALLRYFGDTQIPISFRELRLLSPPSKEMSDRDQFEKALSLAMTARWRAALQSFRGLLAQHANEPSLWKNIAALHEFLLEPDQAVEAWRQYARMPGVGIDEAADAECIAQLLGDEPSYDQVRVTYPVRDTDRLMEKLLSDKQVMRAEVDLRELVGPGEPPPKGVFLLLDRPAPQDGELQLKDLPEVYGALHVYGKQTDRPARAEFLVTKCDDFWARTTALAGVAGEFLGAAEKEEKLAEVSWTEWHMTFRRYTPESLRREPARISELLRQWDEQQYLEQWPQLPNPALDGKKPADVASDSSYQVRLLGAIERLEQLIGPRFNFDRLREKLQLPQAQPIDPAQISLAEVPVHRYRQLQVEKLSDEDLQRILHRSVSLMHGPAVLHVGRELLRRESTSAQRRADVYSLMARTAVTQEERVEYLQQAAEAAQQANLSPAHYLIDLLALHILSGDQAQAEELLTRLQTRHIRERGVAQRLYSLFAQFGAVPTDQPMDLENARPGEVASAATEKAKSQLWTPGGEPGPGAAPTTAEEAASKRLWLPGQ